MRKAFYGIFSLFLLISCTNQTGQEMRTPSDEIQSVDEYFITESKAKQIADSFFSEGELVLVGSETSEALRSSTSEELPAYYIYNNTSDGFVIVSGTEAAYPILGYSNKGRIDMQDLPDGLKYLLGLYSGDINVARQDGIQPSEKVKRLREYLDLRASEPAGDVVVEPLLGDIAWDQMPFYNALAPNPQVPIGCVATATSQIMRYWEYPDKAIGRYSYNSKNFGMITFDFNHTFDWDNMPKETLKEPNEDIANLCFGVAVSINMNFDYAYNGGSGAVHGDVPPALYRHYGYPKTIQNVRRNDYDDDVWTSMVKHELDNHRPVQYGGTGNGGGHSFVLDGYDTTDLFHINWGWAGQSNGWFKLNALDPDDLGTGGGSGGFNKNQDMIINFAPPARIEGDHDEQIKDDEEDSQGILDNGIEYKGVYVPNTLDFYIRYTKFGTLETTSRGSGYAAYLDKAIDVVVGEDLDFTIEYVQNAEKVFPKIAVFIDLDNDGKFDKSTEMIYETPIGEYNQMQSSSYAIKADAQKGLHRMRVINYNVQLKDPNAEVLLNGEVEDYYVNIK